MMAGCLQSFLYHLQTIGSKLLKKLLTGLVNKDLPALVGFSTFQELR